jgi:hypothetical protein
MSAPAVKTIADALATAYSSLTPPSGLAAIRRSTAAPPNAIPTYPFVTVILPEGDLVLMGSGVDLTLNFQTRFWYAKHVGDQARDYADLNKWLGILLWATLAATDLGLAPTVKSAIPSGFRFFLDTYGSVESYGWEIDVPVMLRNVAIA